MRKVANRIASNTHRKSRLGGNQNIRTTEVALTTVTQESDMVRRAFFALISSVAFSLAFCMLAFAFS